MSDSDGSPKRGCTAYFGWRQGIPFSAETKHYTIGPVIDIEQPLRLGLEFGAMYKRVDQQAESATVTGFVTVGEETFPILQRNSNIGSQ
jgi:hypothetical protein